MEYIFGYIDKFANREELLDEESGKWISISKPQDKYIAHVKNFIELYLSDSKFRQIIDDKNYATLNHYPQFNFEDFRILNSDKENDWKTEIPEYVKDYVNINKFME